MCYSTALRKKKEAIEKKLLSQVPAKFPENTEYEPFFHLNGFTHGNLQIITMDEPDIIQSASWGLIPTWATHDPVGYRKKSNTLNARSETIFEKASFKESASEKRCLILADGFYEPHHENSVSIPHFCYQPSKDCPEGELFLFAGLYNELDENITTATILTVDANEFFAEVHNKKKRMPLVLDEYHYEDWIDDLSDPELNEIMATGFTSQPFSAHPISRDLYKKGINTNQPYIIEPVQKDTLF
jgi:putative SOS response-associated peptidase YedK